MKFLFFSQYFWPENFRINELASFFSKKKKNYALTGHPSYPNKYLFQKSFTKKALSKYQNIDIIRVPICPRGYNNISIYLNYLSFFISSLLFGFFKINKKKIDLIFIFCTSPITSAIPGIILKMILKKKSVLWVLDLWSNTIIDLKIIQNKYIIKIFRILVKFIYDNSDLILAQSMSMRSEIKKITNTKCIYFPSWPEENIGIGKYLKKDKIIKCDKSYLKIIFAGNIGQGQSFETLIKCAKLLSKKKIIKWIIIGDGRWKKKLMKLIIKNKLRDDFILINSVPIKEIGAYLNQADALYLSLKLNETYKKTIPGKLQTYMSIGKPIIGSISGETNKIILKAKCGLVSKAEDYIALKNNLLKFYNLSMSKKNIMGKNGKIYSDINFNKKKIFQNLKKEIKRIV